MSSAQYGHRLMPSSRCASRSERSPARAGPQTRARPDRPGSRRTLPPSRRGSRLGREPSSTARWRRRRPRRRSSAGNLRFLVPHPRRVRDGQDHDQSDERPDVHVAEGQEELQQPEEHDHAGDDQRDPVLRHGQVHAAQGAHDVRDLPRHQRDEPDEHQHPRPGGVAAERASACARAHGPEAHFGVLPPRDERVDDPNSPGTDQDLRARAVLRQVETRRTLCRQSHAPFEPLAGPSSHRPSSQPGPGRGYYTLPGVPSQLHGPQRARRERTRRPVRRHPARATAAAPMATHGPSQGCVANGGLTRNITAPTATSVPSAPITARTRVRMSAGRSRPATHSARPTVAATADSRAHDAGEISQLPKVPRTWLLVTAFVQGRAVATNAPAMPSPVTRKAPPPGCGVRPGTVSGTSGPSTAARHSAPTSTPRTGTAQDRHSRRPQPSQDPTEALPGCSEHHPAVRWVFSPVGTRGLYRASGGGEATAPRDPVDTRARAHLASALVDSVPPRPVPTSPRIAVLASGTGTNLQALLDDPFAGRRIALVVSDRAGAVALERARSRGVPAVFLDPASFPGRDAYGTALLALLREHAIGLVVMAGFMRILSAPVVREFEGRMLNVHPSLLPAFPGAHAVAEALAWGARVTGVTVHLVDEEVDHGPIVFQEAVEILPGDDWDALEARVHEVEHRLLPRAVRALAEGRIRVEGRRVEVLADEPAGGAIRWATGSRRCGGRWSACRPR